MMITAFVLHHHRTLCVCFMFISYVKLGSIGGKLIASECQTCIHIWENAYIQFVMCNAEGYCSSNQ